MPFFRTDEKLIYYAHVPKCGGSSVRKYIEMRFGEVAFSYGGFTKLDPQIRWSRTSPQHIDWKNLKRLFPPTFFDAIFAVVRHPVSRVISAYHFQIDVERHISLELPFSDWLRMQADILHRDPTTIDNHFRPQVDFMPNDCTVFHLEYGLEQIIPYFDSLVGNQDGPRAIGHANNREKSRFGQKHVAEPNTSDLALIEEIYADDFARFGYVTEQKYPSSPHPILDPDFLAENSAERARTARRFHRLVARVKRLRYMAKNTGGIFGIWR